jgi:colanic acid/amylovoran biosynthesis protein
MYLKLRIAVDAYFNNNLGDDLFLEILLNRYEEAVFDFMVRDISACKAFMNSPRVNFKSRKQVLRNIKNYEAYIFIGGSLFQEPKYWKKQWKIFNFTVSLFNLFKKSTFVLGCNFGPVKTELYRRSYTKTFKKLTHITVRDQYSFNALKELKTNLTVHPDIVLSMKNNNKINKNNKVVGISVIDWPRNKNFQEYLDFNLNLIQQLILEENKLVRLFSFQNTEHISDLKIINKIIDKLDESIREKIDIVSYDGDIRSFLNKYSECHAMVTSRFHSLILSLIYEQSIFSIIYSNKTLQTTEFLDLSIDSLVLNSLKSSDVNEVKDIVVDNKINYDKRKLSSLSQDAEKHFEKLDKVIRK